MGIISALTKLQNAYASSSTNDAGYTIKYLSHQFPFIITFSIVHGSAEVDGVEDFDAIPLELQELTALHDDGTFRNSFVKIENGSITDNFHFRNWRLLHRHASGVSPYLPACPCSPC